MTGTLEDRLEKLVAFKRMLETAKEFKCIGNDKGVSLMLLALPGLRENPSGLDVMPDPFKQEVVEMAMIGLSIALNVIDENFDVIVRTH